MYVDNKKMNGQIKNGPNILLEDNSPWISCMLAGSGPSEQRTHFNSEPVLKPRARIFHQRNLDKYLPRDVPGSSR